MSLRPRRRTVLKAGGALALTSIVEGPLRMSAAAADSADIALPELSPRSLWYGAPARDWQSEALPVGNGRLGAMLFGDPTRERVQFNEESLWGGVNNYDNALMGKSDDVFDTGVTGFGSYRNFGDLLVTFGSTLEITAPGGPYQDSNSSETIAQTYDGDSHTKWCIIGPPAQVLWQAALPEPEVVHSYSLTSANDVPARDPQEWTLSGSDDAVTWTDLDARTLPAPFEQRFQTKTFEFANTVAFRYYRFTFVPTAGVSHFQVAEVGLGGVDLRGDRAVYLSSPSGHTEDLFATADGDDSTAWRVPPSRGDVVWQAEIGRTVAVTSYRITSAAGEREDDRVPGPWPARRTG
jgi:alpha-L-fucosidase 2